MLVCAESVLSLCWSLSSLCWSILSLCWSVLSLCWFGEVIGTYKEESKSALKDNFLSLIYLWISLVQIFYNHLNGSASYTFFSAEMPTFALP